LIDLVHYDLPERANRAGDQGGGPVRLVAGRADVALNGVLAGLDFRRQLLPQRAVLAVAGSCSTLCLDVL